MKSASFIKRINLEYCYLRNSPPNYAIWQALGTLKNAVSIAIGLNDTEIPTNALSKTDNAPNILRLDLSLGSLRGKSFTIRSKAFDNLNDLDEIIISAPNSGGHTNEGNITFEKEAFMSSKTRNRPLQLKFLYTKLNGHLFDEQTFAGVNRSIHIRFG